MAYIESDQETARAERRGRRLRILAWVGAGVAGGALVVGLLVPAGDDPGNGPTVPEPRGPAAMESQPGRSGPDRDPLVTAQRWLEASRTVQFTDPTSTEWTDRVAPLLTGAAAATQGTSGGSDAGWGQFVQAQCKTSVRDVGTVIPPEAPRSPESVYVQVTGVIATTCESKTYPVPTESAAATLALALGPDGLWRISDRLY